MGLIGDAPGVGKYRETKTTALRSKIMPANVAGSRGAVPKSREAIPLGRGKPSHTSDCHSEKREAQPLRYDASLLYHRGGA